VTTLASGGKASEMRYTPFGSPRVQAGEMQSSRRFTSQNWDAGVGLYDYSARMYNPLIGKFVSADVIVPDGDKSSIVPLTVGFHEPQFLLGVASENMMRWQGSKDAKVSTGPSNPQQLNRYSYALGNPLGFTDPTGHNARCSANFTACSGGEVINNSSKILYVRGDRLNTVTGEVENVIVKLNMGQSSRDLGVLDADEVYVRRDVDGSVEWWRLDARPSDLDTVSITNFQVSPVQSAKGDKMSMVRSCGPRCVAVIAFTKETNPDTLKMFDSGNIRTSAKDTYLPHRSYWPALEDRSKVNDWRPANPWFANTSTDPTM
jgi:RHS repeat-associated protein